MICEPTCVWRPTISRPGRSRIRRHELARVVDRDAELVGLETGRDVGMAAGVDVGVDAHRDARPRLAVAARCASMRSSSPSDSALIVLTPSSIAWASSAVRLGDAGEDDLRRDEAGAQRDVDLAAGIGVDAAAQAAQQPDDRQRRVGLERVVDRVRIRRRTPRPPRGSATRSWTAVDVEGRAVGGRELGERDAVAGQVALLSGKSYTMKRNCTVSRRRARRGDAADL